MKYRHVRLLISGLLSVVVLGFNSSGLAAPGAWFATAPRLNVASSQVDQKSAPLTAPSGEASGVIDSISWQYRSPPGSRMVARLCLQERCRRLELARGISRDFAGLSASGPFRFSFRLADDQSPLVVDAMSLIVNHR